jgi:hypothetical protein
MKFPKDMIKASSALMVAVAVFAFGHVPSAKAQWVVTDPGNTLNTYMTQFQQLNEMRNTLQRWGDTYKHMQQQIASVTSTVGQVARSINGLGGFETLEKVPLDFGVEAKCGIASGGISGIRRDIMAGISSINNDSYVNLVSEQRRLCRMVRTMENQKINASVDMINKTMPEMMASYQGILNKYNAAAGMLSQGDQVQLGDDISSANLEMKAATERYTQLNSQYDIYIGALKDRQRIVAEMIMRGPDANKGIGAVIRTTAVAGALGVSVGDIAP